MATFRARRSFGATNSYTVCGRRNYSMSNVETRVPQELPESILATLAEIGEEINASLNLDRVLSKTATLIKRLIDYEIFTVMLLDERTQTLSNRFAVGYSH